MRTILFDIHGTVLDELHQAAAHSHELLAILKRLDVRIGAFTHGDHRSIVRLETAGVREHFETVVTRERVNGRFSHTASLRKALKDLGAEAEQTIVVSANQFVMQAAKELGVFKTVAVAANVAQTLPGADIQIADLPTLLDVVE